MEIKIPKMTSPIDKTLCEQYRKEESMRLNSIEGDIKDIKKRLEEYVLRTWFFWIAGGIGVLVMSVMSLMYSEIRIISHDVNSTKVDIAVIKNELKIAIIE